MIVFLPEMLAESLCNQPVLSNVFFLPEGEAGDISFPEASGCKA